MTPLSLQKSLKDELNNLFKGYVDINQSNKASSIKFYENSAPIPLDGQNEKDIYPYGIVRIPSGIVPDNGDTFASAKVIILLAYYDEDLSNDGNKYIMSAIFKIVERFRKNSLLDEYFNQSGDIEWSLSDEDTYPYFFGGIEMNFTLPNIKRESVFC